MMRIVVTRSALKGFKQQHLLFSTAAVADTKAMLASIHKHFPAAITNAELVEKVSATLAPFGFGKSTLLATSLCSDEINRVLEHDFESKFNMSFFMGGLCGFPFSGVTGFGAMAHHIPDGGSCLVLYGPHVGVDYEGSFGAMVRRGRAKTGVACGSAIAAYDHVMAVHKGQAKAPEPDIFQVPEEHQQAFVAKMLMPYADRLAKSDAPMVDVPRFFYEQQKKMMDNVIKAGCQEVAGEGKIAMLGGIQINTPENESDYFVPLDFELRSNKNEKLKTFTI